MRGGAAATWLAALVLLPSVAAWDQVGGNAQHNELLTLAPGSLDILDHRALDGGTMATFWTAGILATPEGHIAAVFVPDGEGCHLAVYDDALGDERAQIALDECGSPGLVAYDAPTRGAILCRSGGLDDAIVESRDVREGSQRWALRPAQLDGSAGLTLASCLQAALDPVTRELVVPLYVYSNAGLGVGRTVRNLLVILDADTGEVRSTTEIPSSPALNDAPAPPIGQSSTYFEEYHGVTLTSSGILVSGYVGCPATLLRNVGAPTPSCNEAVAAWFDRDGVFQAKERTVTGRPGSASPDSFSNARGVSKFAASQGATAAFLLGSDVILLNPAVPTPAMRVPVEALSPSVFPFVTQSVWAHDTIVVALVSSLAAFDPTLGRKWAWTEGVDDYISDLVATSGGQLLATVVSTSTGNVTVTVLDARTGQAVLKLPMPFSLDPDETGAFSSKFAPTTDGRALYVDSLGHRVLLGVADVAEVPRVSASDAYPAPGAAVSFAVDAPERAAVDRYIAFWGDGSSEEFSPGEPISHVFATRGDHDVRIVAALADGRTRTGAATVHVGAAPPPQLTALQRAFSAENQEVTFFVLGLLVTIVGVGFTIGRQRRRFNKLERELAAVEEIRMLSIQDPRGAVLALKSYRDRLPADLARGRIDDSQYQVLDIRSARLLKVLRTRLLAPYDARLSVRYHRLLDAAFEDAILQPSERLALIHALDGEEGVGPTERQAIAAFLDDFTSARRELH